MTVTAPASSQPVVVSSSSAAPAGNRPAIVAVTTAGALVTLNQSDGAVSGTLVPGGVLGDEISVSPDGSTVYFAAGHGCTSQIESVPVSGGTPTVLGTGRLPAVSPDGHSVAFATEPTLTTACLTGQQIAASDYTLVIRNLTSGTQKVLSLPPQIGRSGLFPPISHLSWAADDVTLAVSTLAVQDNEGWGLYLVNSAAASYYVPPGPGVRIVPVTGAPDAQRSYLREGVFLPDGNLFVSRACCGGVPPHNTSRLMWEVAQDGALVHQVAIGYPNLDHVSLAADPSGNWLLYLAGHDLYVSHGGATPVRLGTGFVAAAWV
ncbi:MAG TPA: hypothetical protein VF843_14965 [Streptosporangiaceae bacterium]